MDPWTEPDKAEIRRRSEQRKRHREFHAFREDLTRGRTSRFRPTDDLEEDLDFESTQHRDLSKALRQFEETPDESEQGLVEPFNLQDERESRQIDGAGNLQLRKQEGEKDSWADALEELPVKKVKVTGENEEAPPPEPVPSVRLKSRLHALMHDGETVAQTLNRLKGTQTAIPTFKKNQRKKDTPAVSTDVQSNPDFPAAVEVVSALIASGDMDVHEWKRSDLESLYKVQTEGRTAGPYVGEQVRRFQLQGVPMQVLRVTKQGKAMEGEAWTDLASLSPEDLF